MRVFSFLLLLGYGVVNSQDYSSWNYASTISLNTAASGAQVNGNVSNFPVMIRLTSTNFNFSQANNGNSIRFSDAIGTALSYDIEWWNTAGQEAVIWVLVPVIAGNSITKITMFWGNSSAISESSPNAVFPTAGGFAAVWHMEEAGGNIVDATSNGNTGAGAGGVDAVPSGIMGNAQVFDGTDDYISIPNVTSPTGTAYTISAWINSSNLTGVHHFVSQAETGEFGAYINDSLAGAHVKLADTVFPGLEIFSLAVNQWHHYTATWEKGDSLTLYVDGEWRNTNLIIADSSLKAGGSNLKSSIGAQYRRLNFFQGLIDEVRISNVARSGDWVKLSYMNQRAGEKLVTIGPGTPQTQDFDNPLADTFSPANGETGIGIGANLVITFNEPVVKGTNNIQIKKFSDNSLIESITVTDPVKVVVAGAAVTINPAANLQYLTRYYVEVPPEAFDDISGNSFAGISGSVWNFTTVSQQQTAPKITKQPADVSVNEGGTATFKVTATGTSLTYQWKKNTIIINGATGNVYTINSVAQKDNGTKYKCVVTNGLGSVTSNAALLSVISGPTNSKIPKPVTPAEGITLKSTVVNFKWTEVQDAVSYHIQIADDKDLNNIVINILGIDDTTRQVTLPEKSTTYYWRVRGVNSQGGGTFSGIWTFKTGNAVNINEAFTEDWSLTQNYDANSPLLFSVSIPTASKVRIELVNPGNGKVTLLLDRYLFSGFHGIERPQAIGSGIYLYRINAGNINKNGKVVVLP